jgi:hypothetical protein
MVPGAGTRNSNRIKKLGNPHSQLISTNETGACLPQRTTIVPTLLWWTDRQIAIVYLGANRAFFA